MWTSEGAPEAVRQAVGGGCRGGWGRLLSVTNAVEAGTWRQAGRRLGALEAWGGTSPPLSNAPPPQLAEGGGGGFFRRFLRSSSLLLGKTYVWETQEGLENSRVTVRFVCPHQLFVLLQHTPQTEGRSQGFALLSIPEGGGGGHPRSQPWGPCGTAPLLVCARGIQHPVGHRSGP